MGELWVGICIDVVLFGFEMVNGEMEGYGVDLMVLIVLKLVEEMGKIIMVDLDRVDFQSCFEAIVSGELDIVCEVIIII